MVLVSLWGPVCWLFSGALAGREAFAFRDAAHFYHPLYRYVAQRWAQGEIPLWNPLENIGQPLLADCTSAALYPAKIVFALPCSYTTSFNLYIVGHLLLAGAGAYCLARRWRVSRLGAGLSALSFAFSGSVLFQYCNVIFLVGAAWLPWALLAADQMLVRRSAAWAIALGAVLALMVLGGDPQAAYHAGLAAAVYALLLWRSDRLGRRADEAAAAVQPQRRRMPRAVLLAVAAGAALLLAAVQILPSSEWTRQSQRAQYDQPRNIYEWASRAIFPDQTADVDNSPEERTGPAATLLGHVKPGTHHNHSYHFSVGPWHLAEFVWPNFSGRLLPTNEHWIRALPAEGRTWTPSLYAGLLPLLLVFAALRFRSPRGSQFASRRALQNGLRRQWLSWLALLFLLGSFGWYGIGWIVMEIYYGCLGPQAPPLPFGSPFGGVYWLMQVLLPGYVYFRYPAKLLIVAAMAMSLLAGLGWDQCVGRKTGKLRFALRAIAAISAAAAALVAAISNLWPLWQTFTANIPADSLFGPFDADGAARGLILSFGHTFVVSILLAVLLWRCEKGNQFAWGMALLLLTSLEMAVAGQSLIATAPAQQWETTPALASVISGDPDRPNEAEPGAATRIYRSPPWDLPPWAATSSPARLRVAQAWDHNTLRPRYHLPAGISQIESETAFTALDHAMAIRTARRFGRAQGLPHPQFLKSLGTRYVIAPENIKPTPTMPEAAASLATGMPAGVRLLRNEAPFPRAWIVHQVQTMPLLESRSAADVYRRTRDVLFPQGRWRDLSQQAVVEDENFPSPPEPKAAIAPGAENCQIVEDRPEFLKIHAVLKQPGLLVVSDTFDPAWQATVETTTADTTKIHTVPIVRTNRILRGISLPAGEHRLTMRYQPQTFHWGAWLSAAAWATLLAASIGWMAIGKRIK